MILAIDVGNTSCSCAVFDKDVLVRQWRFPTPANGSLQSWEDSLGKDLAQLHHLTSVAVASVVPQVNDALIEVVARHGRETFFVRGSTPLPIRNFYEPASSVGVDRIVNAVGALHVAGAPAVVVDIGTAVTLDCVDANKGFVGGAILPGPKLQAWSLHSRTAALPEVELNGPLVIPARSTSDGIRGGVLVGLAGAIDRLVSEAVSFHDDKVPIVITGGYREFLLPHLKITFRVEPYLTLIGIREALYYQERI